MNDDTSPSGPSGEGPRFAARSMMSPGLQAALKASTDAAVRPMMAEVSKAFLGASLPKTFLGGGVPKVVLGVGPPRPELGGFAKLAGGTMVGPGLQAALKASSGSVLGAAMPKVFLGPALSKAFLGSEETTDERSRKSTPVWWACQDLNLGPHPYQVSGAKRCADRHFPRSLASVRGEGMRS